MAGLVFLGGLVFLIGFFEDLLTANLLPVLDLETEFLETIGALATILLAKGFLVGSMTNSNFSLLTPLSIGAPLYLSTASDAWEADLKVTVAIPLDCPFSL